MAASYLILLIGIGVLKRYFIDRGVWEALANSTTVVGLSAIDTVRASGDKATSVGEGLADALDVGAF